VGKKASKRGGLFQGGAQRLKLREITSSKEGENQSQDRGRCSATGDFRKRKKRKLSSSQEGGGELRRTESKREESTLKIGAKGKDESEGIPKTQRNPNVNAQEGGGL